MKYEDLASAVMTCASDMASAAETKKIGLDMQIRAYDLQDRILDMGREILSDAGSALGKACEEYSRIYENLADVLPSLYDQAYLEGELRERLAPMHKEMNDIRFEAASAASLHEFAKEVFEVWQTAGIFARRRALRELRERAGFRLESHRIGNYVAKTFDLMNEAQARFAHAQQAMFAADVRYKIRPDIYAGIYEILTSAK